MKNKIILIIALLISFTTINAQNNHGYVINGQLTGLPDGTKVYLRAQGKDTVAKTVSKGDRFTFKGRLPLDGRFHFIVMDTLVSKVMSKAIFIVNKSISISGIVGQREVVVEGSPGHIEYNDLLKLQFNHPAHLNYKKHMTALNDISKQMQKVKGDSLAYKILYKKWMDLNNNTSVVSELADIEQKQLVIDWIAKHTNSLFAPYAIIGYAKVLGKEGMQKFFDNLSADVKLSYYGQELKNTLNNKLIRNEIIPNFTITNVEGRPVKILDIAAKSKYTLIDCWASWCHPCRSEIPFLKKQYESYKDKGFNILGISSDSNESAWKKAIKDDNTTWTHTLQKDKIVSKTFGISSIPSYILIDDKGRLLAFDSSMSNIPSFGGGLRGEALEKKLEKLLAK